MRILFISKDILSNDVIRNSLSGLAEKDSIYFVHSFSEAVDFINQKTVNNQDALDLIICHNSIDNKLALDFKNTLTSDNTRTYSGRDFNLFKIPIVLIIGLVEHLEFYKRQGFSDIIRDEGADKLDKQILVFKNAITNWRKAVLNELDNLGIKFNSGVIDYSYYFSKKNKYIDTNILSFNFQQFPRMLKYYWLEHNQRQIELAINEFLKLLQRTHKSNKKQEEKLYHKFFNRNKSFLERDNYSRSWYEQNLPINLTESFEPDYSLKPNLNYETDLSILEVKLPNEGFIKQRKFHPTMYSKLINHLTQINDYKDYLESEEHYISIQEKFGWLPKRIEYKLLIGRQIDKDENINTIEKRMNQFGQGHIYLMTYDELLDYQVKYLDRLNLLEVR